MTEYVCVDQPSGKCYKHLKILTRSQEDSNRKGSARACWEERVGIRDYCYRAPAAIRSLTCVMTTPATTINSPIAHMIVNGRRVAPANAKWSMNADVSSCAVTANRIALPTPKRGARNVMLKI